MMPDGRGQRRGARLGLAAIPFVSSSVGGSSRSRRRARPTTTRSKAATEAGICTAKPKTAPLDFVVKDMNGADVKLADYKGKVVMLNFWATWCGPCKVEIPMFIDLQQRYGSQGLAFLGISVDDAPEQLQPFAQEYKMNYPVLIGDRTRRRAERVRADVRHSRHTVDRRATARSARATSASARRNVRAGYQGLAVAGAQGRSEPRASVRIAWRVS